MIQEKIKNLIQETLKNFGMEDTEVTLEHPADLKMGDYSTNIAMVLAKRQKTNPKVLAEKIVEEINKNLPKEVSKVEAAGAGFINFYLAKEFFAQSIKEIIENKDFGKNEMLKGKKIMVEYTDPNPFKPFHIGHLMTNAIGESIARIVGFSGANTIRANYQGDVGLHVAKAIWGLQKKGLPEENLSIIEKSNYIGECYTEGATKYEDDPEIKKEIDAINKKVYDKGDEEVNKIYDWGFKITMDAFEELYKMLGTKFEHYFLESQMAPIGQKIVKENLGKIFAESDSAVVFKAEEHDPKLHTRVFVTSQGLPTYETKELGLTQTKFEKENPDLSIVITAIEQGDYMRVVQKALSLIHPDYESRMKHITHGMMRFASGKMSSRKGNVITGESLIRDTCALIQEKIKDRDFNEEDRKEVATSVGVAAIKYSILRQSTGGDIIYDVEKSISFEGDSGPYLQYSYARAHSLVEKAKIENMQSNSSAPETWETIELEKMLYKFEEIVMRSAQEFEPHYIANYLIDLARCFNSYYASTKIIPARNADSIATAGGDKDDTTSPYKIAITEAFSHVMKNGLFLLGIKVPERM